jgi:hydrogenase nickel incorporation protein HypB
MCASCGCGGGEAMELESGATEGLFLLRPPHHHAHEHSHAHDHEGTSAHAVSIEQAILAKNDALAARNRQVFATAKLAVFNLLSAPGAGKTSLLEALIARVKGRVPLAVIEGDQETERDAERIRAHGVPAIQVNTASGCHLDAEMVAKAAARLELRPGSLLLVENVGNLVCPALFDLGERQKIVLASVTEGEDKPLKYPHVFRAASVLVLTKTDLLPHLDFDRAAFLANAKRINPTLRVFELSCRDGTGLGEFIDWLTSEVEMRAGGSL